MMSAQAQGWQRVSERKLHHIDKIVVNLPTVYWRSVIDGTVT